MIEKLKEYAWFVWIGCWWVAVAIVFRFTTEADAANC